MKFKTNQMQPPCVHSSELSCSHDATSVPGNCWLLCFSQVVEFRSCLDSLIITMAHWAPTMGQVLFRSYRIYPPNNPQGSVMLPSVYVCKETEA